MWFFVRNSVKLKMTREIHQKFSCSFLAILNTNLGFFFTTVYVATMFYFY